MTEEIKTDSQSADKDSRKNKKADAAESAPQPLTYVGPHRPYDLPLMQYQTFKGGVAPEFCRKQFAAHPHLKACFVGLPDLAQALKNMRDPQSPLAQAMDKVAAETMEQRKAAARGN